MYIFNAIKKFQMPPSFLANVNGKGISWRDCWLQATTSQQRRRIGQKLHRHPFWSALVERLPQGHRQLLAPQRLEQGRARAQRHGRPLWSPIVARFAETRRSVASDYFLRGGDFCPWLWCLARKQLMAEQILRKWSQSLAYMTERAFLRRKCPSPANTVLYV